MLYPQNGDRIVTIDSVTSLHLVYTLRPCLSVCPSQAGVLSNRLHGSYWNLALRLRSTFHAVCFKEIRVSPKIRVLHSGIFLRLRKKFRHGMSTVAGVVNLVRPTNVACLSRRPYYTFVDNTHMGANCAALLDNREPIESSVTSGHRLYPQGSRWEACRLNRASLCPSITMSPFATLTISFQKLSNTPSFGIVQNTVSTAVEQLSFLPWKFSGSLLVMDRRSAGSS